MRVLKFNLKNLLVMGMFLLTGFWALAQTEQDSVSTLSLNEVVVTGTKFEIPTEKSGKTIYKLSAKEIEQNACKTVVDLLNEVPGIQMEGNFGSPGSNISYFVRGGRNKNSLILIDGVPLNDPSAISSSFDLRLLPLGQIESIEILKGGLSTLYGTGASSAVINIKLKEAANDGTHGLVDYNFGSFNTHTLSANVNGTKDKLSYVVSGGIMDSEGFSSASDENVNTDFQKDGMNQKNGSIKVGYEVSDQLKLNVNAGYDEFSADYDDGAFTDAENRNDATQLRIGFAPTYQYDAGKIKFNILLNSGSREFVSQYPSEYESKNLQSELTHEHQINSQIKTLIGVNYQKQSSKLVVDPDPGFEDFNLVDPFASIFFDHESGLNLHAGIRLNNHSEYGTEFVYNINPSFLLVLENDISLKFLGSVATTYITPSIFQLYSFYGNTELKPEKSLNYEGGVSFYLGKSVELNTVYFRRDETNPVFFNSVQGSEGNWVSFYDNGTRERVVSGFEADLKWAATDDLTVRANYSYASTDDESTFYRIPNAKYGASINWSATDNLGISGKLNYTGDRTIAYYDATTFSSVELDVSSYILVDLFASYKVLDNKLTFYGGVNNVLDEDFISIYGFTTRGRNATFGLNYKF